MQVANLKSAQQLKTKKKKVQELEYQLAALEPGKEVQIDLLEEQPDMADMDIEAKSSRTYSFGLDFLEHRVATRVSTLGGFNAQTHTEELESKLEIEKVNF